MARLPRHLLRDGLVHVGARGNARGTIFRDDDDRVEFLAQLDAACARSGLRVVAFDLLTNHYHLVAHGTVAALSTSLHLLQGGYARWANVRHGRCDHLFGDRFWAAAIDDDWHEAAAIRFVLENATRAGMWRHPLDDPWSSLRMTIGAEEPLGCLDAAAAVAPFGGVDGLLAAVGAGLSDPGLAATA